MDCLPGVEHRPAPLRRDGVLIRDFFCVEDIAPALVGVIILAQLFTGVLGNTVVAEASIAILDVGYTTGSASSANLVPDATTTAGSPPTPAPTLTALIPVLTATPDEDGNLFHIVQPGEALRSIAMAYKISLAELMALNGYTEKTVIYPGEKVLVRRVFAHRYTHRAAQRHANCFIYASTHVYTPPDFDAGGKRGGLCIPHRCSWHGTRSRKSGQGE